MKKLLSILCMLFAGHLMANHLVGGEISYTCMGGFNYQIHLRIYRDCNSTGAPFDQQAAITIFRTSNQSIVSNLLVNKGANINLPATTSNPCMQSPPNICTEYTDYYATVSLPPIAGGYTITHQRCCRNSTISNVPNPSTWGNTYTVQIPSMDNCNTSPAFNGIPPIVMCISSPMNIDCSASEPDGDSIYYNLCSVLHGGGQSNNTSNPNCATCPTPIPAQAPSYTTVPYVAPNSATNPIPAVGGPIQLDPVTGILTGTPTQIGQYVVGICVEEYRNGILLDVVRRDYQFNVVSCLSNVVSGIVPQTIDSTTVCVGKTIQFQEDAVNAVTYSWDFGETSTLSDTSHSANPTWTFSDTGYFTVRLIVNEGWPCSDTAYEVFYIQSPVSSAFNITGNPCLGNPNIDVVVSSPSSDVDYEWKVNGPVSSFGIGTNPTTLSLSVAGTYTIKLIASKNGCSDSTSRTFTIYPYPQLTMPLSPIEACAPYQFDFTPQTQSGTPLILIWDYGDGTTSVDSVANHLYTTPGTYTIKVTGYTSSGCLDTISYEFPNIITVHPSPNADVSVGTSEVSIYNPNVNVSALNLPSSGGFQIDMDDGNIYSNQSPISHRYSDTGHYKVTLVVWNQYNCYDTATVMVRVKPEVLIFFPNAFTPNDDYSNDGYRPVTAGLKEYHLAIRDRWGVLVFESTDPNDTWNGRYNNDGQFCQDGAYIALLTGMDQDGNPIEKIQTVLLYR